jgi:hypothetical protein
MKKIVVLLLFLSVTLFAKVGVVTALKGSAELLRDGMSQSVAVGTTLQVGDEIKTAVGAKLQLMFEDKTVISLGQKSHFKVDDYLYDAKDPRANFSISTGIFKSITGKIGKIAPKQFKVKTANATIGVRGTTFMGEVTTTRDIITCSSGQIEVSNARGNVLVNAGERTIVEESKVPKQSQKVNNIIIKSLDEKSNPSVVEAPVVANSDTKIADEKSPKNDQRSEEKSAENFTPWVEEEQTLADIERIVGEPTPSYEGKVVEGSTSHGTIDSASSHVKMDFDLGAGTMSGDINMQDSANNSYDIDVAGGVKGDGSFQ